jgi:hypothetical protein
MEIVKAWAWPAVSTPIAKAMPRAGLSNDAQRLRRSGLKLLTLALGDGLEQRERVSIWIWNTCELLPQISRDAEKYTF